MFKKKLTWHKVAESKEELFADGNRIVEISVAEKQVCLVLHNQNLHACSAKCPHAGGRMAQGWLDSVGNIVCPLHRYRFDVKNGRNVSGEGYYLKTYLVESREEGIFIGIESGIF